MIGQTASILEFLGGIGKLPPPTCNWVQHHNRESQMKYCFPEKGAQYHKWVEENLAIDFERQRDH